MVKLAPNDKHRALVTYLRVKTDEEDRHGVSDAANDLRVLEAQYPLSSHSTECACISCDAERAK